MAYSLNQFPADELRPSLLIISSQRVPEKIPPEAVPAVRLGSVLLLSLSSFFSYV